MELDIVHGDIVDLEVEALICSANPMLNMSGGVNGEILRRGGKGVQAELRTYLEDLGKRFVDPGTVVRTSAGPAKCRAIFHAVSIDGFYESTVDLVEATLREAYRMIGKESFRTVSVPALATGYGPLKMKDFAEAVKRSLDALPDSVETLFVVLRDERREQVFRDAYEALQ